MVTDNRIWPDIAIPPGELLSETLESLGMSQVELARRTGRPVQAINEIVRGLKEITPETALQFERVLGVPAHVWVRLEADYRYNLARLHEKKRLEEEIPLSETYPYKEMASYGWVPDVQDKATRVVELLRFFRVSSLRHLELRELAVMWRKSAKVEISRQALLAWLTQGEREADANPVTGDFDRERLRDQLPELRRLTRDDPRLSTPKIRERLGACGISLVFVPHLKKTGVHGATQWLGQRAVVQLSVRYRWSDIFWFSFFHELGHLLLHHRKGVFVNPEGTEKNVDELAADRFASDTLIPPERYGQFCKGIGKLSAQTIQGFADAIEIAPSIVVGRLQHDEILLRSQLNYLRPKYELTPSEQASDG